MSAENTADREVVLSRLINAPRDRVWSVSTEPDQLEQWWGPDGFSITTHEIDVRVGGIWRFMMHGPDGRDYPNWIRFTELTRPERIAHDHGADDDTVHFRAVITFEDQGGKTLLTMRSVFPTAEALQHVVKEHNAIEGGKQTLGRLAEYVEGK